MAPRRLVPDKTTLSRWAAEGLTHEQMAERHWQETNIRVSRAAISVAMGRYGMAKQGVRHKDTLPWRVKQEHIRQYPARMLRLLGKRRANMPLTEDETKRLDSWLDLLDRERAVVAYSETDGFLYTDRARGERSDLPIRARLVRAKTPTG
jgi:hypothetical protein